VIVDLTLQRFGTDLTIHQILFYAEADTRSGRLFS